MATFAAFIAATTLLAIIALSPATALAQFNARATINVTGFGNVATETNYIPNVVLHENGAASFEALKAQAVAARTFAYYKMNLQGFINDGTSDQVYSGSGSPQAIHNAAALATEGEILYVFDNIAPTADVLIASFFVAGAIPTGPFNYANPGIIYEAGDSDPTNTEKWVTYTYANGLTGGNNQGTALGFRGTVSNPNWPNRGAMSQNGGDYLSDNSVSYLDILKYYYGADIQLRTAATTGTGVTFGTKTLVNFDNYSDRNGRTFAGNEGTLGYDPTFSGSTTANLHGSTADRSSVEKRSGTHSQLIDIQYDETLGGEFLLRELSGAKYAASGGGTNAGTRVANLQFEAQGSIGFWLKTDDPGVEVTLALDDPDTGDRGLFRSVIADNQWHKYEWFLDRADNWDPWAGVGGNGQIDGDRASLDSIQFRGSADAQIYLDDVFWNPSAVLAASPASDFDIDGDVDAGDLTMWRRGFGSAGGKTTGDADSSGAVDGADFLAWQRGYAPAAGPVAAAVPEPASSDLAIWGVGAIGAVLALRRCAKTSGRCAETLLPNNRVRS